MVGGDEGGEGGGDDGSGEGIGFGWLGCPGGGGSFSFFLFFL